MLNIESMKQPIKGRDAIKRRASAFVEEIEMLEKSLKEITALPDDQMIEKIDNAMSRLMAHKTLLKRSYYLKNWYIKNRKKRRR